MPALPRPTRYAALRLLSLAALALALAACETTRNLMPDQPPTVTLTSGPIDTVSAPQSWLVDIAWTGNDPDGRIDHYEYAIDPPTLKRARLSLAETTWVKTTETHVVARFHASHPDSLGPGATASEFHTFVLRAVDDRGGMSPNVVRAFYAYTVAPDVQITSPGPSVFLPVGIPFRLSWVGNDPDGGGDNRPSTYRLRFLPLAGGENTEFAVNPDSLLRLGTASGWAGWRTVGGDTTSITVDDAEIQPGTLWLAAVVAVDAAGATTPYLSYDRNLLVFEVLATGGPAIHVFSTFFDYVSPPSSLSIVPGPEVAAGQSVSFHVEGIASAGRRITGTRWAVDMADVNDETPRSDPNTDLAHWSAPQTGVIVAAFSLSPGQHQLAVETFDDFGGQSLLFLRLSAIDFPLAQDLLVVNDTRFEVDKFPLIGSGTPSPYTRPWPSSSELDTLLFARGGVPWQGTQNPTSGVLSAPGLLAGYAFDTLGTRLGLEHPADGVSLSRLAGYRHVLWLVDANGAQFGPDLIQGVFPVTALRAMSAPGRTSSLSQYIQFGGQVWLAGGGTAYASLVSFDVRSNNVGQTTVFTARDGELGPGRVMYDAAHVRSALGVTKSAFDFTRSPAAVGGWSGHGPDGTLSAPDYSRAPASMRRRDPGTDPLPPTRLPNQASLYYPTAYPAGFVLEPNSITEDFDPDPAAERVESALDTVYDVSGGVLPIPSAPVMLYYHGRENPPFVYTGFEPWDYTRADCQGLVDFVLGDIWKLPKSAGASAHPAGSATRVQRPAAPRLSAGLDPRRMRP
jgi:hypothetical protein